MQYTSYITWKCKQFLITHFVLRFSSIQHYNLGCWDEIFQKKKKSIKEFKWLTEFYYTSCVLKSGMK